ncbi:DHH family phosphoesterase [Candidatus Dojkabacteria bacterium]|nr:DHH family phosphoesterase [Candidatus Dojkabacteria bacterium]
MDIPVKIKSILNDTQEILIIVSRPIDNDCIASGIGLKKHFERKGKNVTLISPTVLPSFVESFPLHELVEVLDTRVMSFENFDLIIAVDGGNTKQFAEVQQDSDFNFGGNKNVLNIDHHLGNTHFAKYEIWDPSVSSTTELVLSKIIDIREISKDEATLLYAGIVGDTGNFNYGFSKQTLEFAAQLFAKGADFNLILNEYFYKNKEEHFDILAWMIQNTRYNFELGYSYVILEYERLEKKFDWDYEEIKGGIRLYENYFSRAIEGMNIGMVIKVKRNKIDISMRGKQKVNRIPLPEIGKAMNCEVGGHFNSSGFSIQADTSDFINRIEQVIKDLNEKYKKS